MTVDVLAEFADYSAGITPRHVDRLVAAYAVPRRWLYSGAARVGITRAVCDARTWQPHPTGRAMLVVPDWPMPDPWERYPVPPGDLIAFDPRQPGRWWWRTDTAALLNPEAVDRAEHYDEQLVIHATPLDWLRAGGRGAVVLDWRAHLPLYLRGARNVVAGNAHTARRLQRAMTAPAWTCGVAACPAGQGAAA